MKHLKTYNEAWMSPVVKLDLDGKYIRSYECINDAAKDCSINRTDISNVLAGRRKSAGGFKWMNKYDYDKKRLNESLKIDEYELKDILVDLEDDGFKVIFDQLDPIGILQDEQGDYLHITITLPSKNGEIMTGPYTGQTRVVADIYTWNDIKDSIERLEHYINELGLQYKFDLVDQTGKSHRIEIHNDKFMCVSYDGRECRVCKYGLPKLDLTNNIYVFKIIILK